MVHHHRNPQLKKSDIEEGQVMLLECGNTPCRKTRANHLCLLFFFAVVCCTLIIAPRIYSLSFYYLGIDDNGVGRFGGNEGKTPVCPSGKICCDRSAFRSDICFMNGDIRTLSASSSVFLYSSINNSRVSTGGEEVIQTEKIKPYTRKWETSVMNTIDELNLISKKKPENLQACEVQHSVPAIFFSTGGYTGNVYHEFNDGILPLFITSQQYNKEVIFVILEYHDWWISKYGDILSHLSNYPPIDFNKDPRTHCFSEAIVGLKIHDELTVDSSQMPSNKSIWDFRELLDDAYKPRILSLIQEEEQEAANRTETENAQMVKETGELQKRPKLVIIARNGSREILNQEELVQVAETIGFCVEILQPRPWTELAKIYRALNSSDVMIGVHGAAMTHFLFMKPGSVFVQVLPLGTVWAGETYYGEPAVKMALKYIPYKILNRESSLYDEYEKDDPVLRDPRSMNKKGWEVTKKVYLEGQNVRLDLNRFRKRLVKAYDYSVSNKNSPFRKRMVLQKKQ